MNVLLPREELKQLTAPRKGPCVSIFLPTHRTAVDARQDPIRFKNLMKDIENRLAEKGFREPETRKFLEPARKLLDDPSFWLNRSDGLALFLSPDYFRHFRFPWQFPELAVVSARFHIKPLLSIFREDGRFYILALSQNQVRLLQGSRFNVQEIELIGVPESLAEVLKYVQRERQLQFHTRTPSEGGDRPAMFHGQGTGVDDRKSNILRYFQQIDKGLWNILNGENVPLILAGVEFLLPIYREANSFPGLIQEGIPGNPQGLSDAELHQKAWNILEPLFRKNLEDAYARYRKLLGTGLASKQPQEVIPGAYNGRVEVLFVPAGKQLWGSFDPATNDLRLATEEKPGMEDLLDFAAVYTFLTGGKVYTVEPPALPDEPLAAVFRY